MTLPGDDHKGWDLLLAAVMTPDEETDEPDDEQASPVDEPQPTRVLDLQALQPRAHAGEPSSTT